MRLRKRVLTWKPAAMCLSPPHGRHLLGGSSFFRPGPPSWLLRDFDWYLDPDRYALGAPLSTRLGALLSTELN